MIYVYTSIVGGWDNLRPPADWTEDSGTVRWLCFTDVPNLPHVEPWEYRPLYDLGHNGKTSRGPKLLPHLYLPEDAEYSIYHDGNLQLKERPLALMGLLDACDWAAYKHSGRDCVYDEAVTIKQACPLVPHDLVDQEIAAYREIGHPEHDGLWANGLILRRHIEEVAALNEHWWSLFACGCGRDQLSFPVARRIAGLNVSTITDGYKGFPFSSPYVNFHWHAAWTDKPSSVEYREERASLRDRLARLRDVTGCEAIRYPDH